METQIWEMSPMAGGIGRGLLVGCAGRGRV